MKGVGEFPNIFFISVLTAQSKIIHLYIKLNSHIVFTSFYLFYFKILFFFLKLIRQGVLDA